jgi:hypothetical protein
MKSIYALFILLFSLPAIGQNVDEEVYDTAKRQDPYSTDFSTFIRNRQFPDQTDSSMLYTQQYDITKRNHVGIQNLGDVNTPFIDLQYKPFERTGFVSGMTPFMNLYWKADDARFYNALLPFTQFHYAQGSGGQRGMIDFDAFHTQNIGKRFNIAAKYHSTSNDGSYSRMSFSCKNVQLSGYYTSKNFRYTAAYIATWNKVNMMENGGIDQSPETDTLFKSLSANVRIVDVSLSQARNINRYREHKVQQVYWLLMDKSKSDKDSLSDPEGSLGISHSFSAIRQANYYTDVAADYGFYDSVYNFNADGSSDSFGVMEYRNTIELFTPINKKSLSFRAGLGYDYFAIHQSANSDNYRNQIAHNSSVFSQFNFKIGQFLQSEAYGIFYFEGYNQADYLLRWKNQTFIGRTKKWNATASLQASSHKPFYKQLNLFSNHFLWNNTFEKTAYQSLKVNLSKAIKRPKEYGPFYYSLPPKAFNIGVQYSLIDNLVYYGSDNTPQQASQGQSCFQGNAEFHVNLKAFQLHQDFVYQVFSKNLEPVIQLPNVISKTSLYFQTMAFKKASFIQIGIDAYMTSSYKAGFYNPGLQNFRVSNVSVGAYPFFDVFINAEVKTARIFFKMEHVNQDLFSLQSFPNYIYVSPYQPSAPRRFRLGFVWKFYY